MGKRIKIVIICLLIVIFGIIAFLLFSDDNAEIKTIKSDKELSRIYNSDNTSVKEIVANIITMPFSVFGELWLRLY